MDRLESTPTFFKAILLAGFLALISGCDDMDGLNLPAPNDKAKDKTPPIETETDIEESFISFSAGGQKLTSSNHESFSTLGNTPKTEMTSQHYKLNATLSVITTPPTKKEL
jgi:hypothetical protein